MEIELGGSGFPPQNESCQDGGEAESLEIPEKDLADVEDP